MSFALLAHSGHWLVNVLYIVPLLIVVAMLGVTMVRDRRAESAERAGPPPGDAPADETPADKHAAP